MFDTTGETIAASRPLCPSTHLSLTLYTVVKDSQDLKRCPQAAREHWPKANLTSVETEEKKKAHIFLKRFFVCVCVRRPK